jgi:hypothetical protein
MSQVHAAIGLAFAAWFKAWLGTKDNNRGSDNSVLSLVIFAAL